MHCSIDIFLAVFKPLDVLVLSILMKTDIAYAFVNTLELKEVKEKHYVQFYAIIAHRRIETGSYNCVQSVDQAPEKNRDKVLEKRAHCKSLWCSTRDDWASCWSARDYRGSMLSKELVKTLTPSEWSRPLSWPSWSRQSQPHFRRGWISSVKGKLRQVILPKFFQGRLQRTIIFFFWRELPSTAMKSKGTPTLP